MQQNQMSSPAGVAASVYNYFNNPYDEEMGYLKKIPSTISPLYQPYQDSNKFLTPYLQNYVSRGSNAGDFLNSQYRGMSSPFGAQNLASSFGSNFMASPDYNYRVNQSIGAANRVAAAGGMLGSPAEQSTIANQIGQMAKADYSDYVSRAMDIYFKGLVGLNSQENLGANVGTNMYGTNANMTDRFAQTLAYNLMNQGMTAGNSQGYGNDMITYALSFL